MRGVLLENGVARVTEVPAPVEADGECRVRVLRAGVCATDLALARGYMGFRGVPGHEFVGEALDGPLTGRRVVGEINAACGACDACRGGQERHCPARTVLGILGRPGAFAEELTLPAVNLHAVPETVSTDAATFVEPLAAAFEIPTQVAVAGKRALVIGDGRLGLLCAQVLALHGADVALDGRHPERAAFLCGGVTYRARPDAELFDLVVEATGSPRVLQAALQRVAPRGTLVLKTTSEAAEPLDLAPLVVHEITLIGSRCGPFAPALDALARKSIDVEALIDARYPLEDAPRALEHAARPGVLKVLLDVASR